MLARYVLADNFQGWTLQPVIGLKADTEYFISALTMSTDNDSVKLQPGGLADLRRSPASSGQCECGVTVPPSLVERGDSSTKRDSFYLARK